MIRLMCIGLGLVSAGCAPLAAGTQYFGRATPLCHIIDNEQSYAGRQVLVSALLRHTPHGRVISDPGCNGSAALEGSSEFWSQDARRVVEAALSDNRRADIAVVVSGVLQPWVQHEGGRRIIRGGGPLIQDARIVAARQP